MISQCINYKPPQLPKNFLWPIHNYSKNMRVIHQIKKNPILASSRFDYQLTYLQLPSINQMNKQSQKRVIQINHALSGIYGQPIKSTAIKINDARKQILKKLDRKKKLSAIIYDELYSYLEKFPEEKSGLNQQFVKKKKARMSEFQERYIYKSPNILQENKSLLTQGAKAQLQHLSFAFRHLIEPMESESSSSKD